MKAGLICMLVAVAGLGGTAHAGDARVESPIKAFLAAFNKGDNVGAAATHAASGVTIVDEVAPYIWTGKGAFAAWGGALAKDSAANGITDQSVTLGAPTRELVSDTHAYVIVPSVYAFKQKGVAMREAAQMTFALERGPAGWKISGWTWTGPNASRAR